ncbi:MAG: hypothetical protein R3Y62_02185 [Eubacteriales bacterium]
MNTPVACSPYLDSRTGHQKLGGTKLKANANNYSWVWKKSCIRNRNKVFEKITALLEPINQMFRLSTRSEFEVRQDYTLEYISHILETFLKETGLKTSECAKKRAKVKHTATTPTVP